MANLDPAAESFDYSLAFDIRDLISVEDVMEELDLGPNGTCDRTAAKATEAV